MIKKKILIGSIGTVFIIVIATFTTAIGTNNIKIQTEKESPLFSIRKQKATIIDKETPAATSCYVGKGYTMLSLPLIENKLKYIFNIDVSTEKLEEIRNQIQNDPSLQQEFLSGKNSQILTHILELLGISTENNNAQTQTMPPTECGVTECNWNQCSCTNQWIARLALFAVLTLGLLIPLFLGTILIFGLITEMTYCDELPSLDN